MTGRDDLSKGANGLSMKNLLWVKEVRTVKHCGRLRHWQMRRQGWEEIHRVRGWGKLLGIRYQYPVVMFARGKDRPSQDPDAERETLASIPAELRSVPCYRADRSGCRRLG